MDKFPPFSVVLGRDLRRDLEDLRDKSGLGGAKPSLSAVMREAALIGVAELKRRHESAPQTSTPSSAATR